MCCVNDTGAFTSFRRMRRARGRNLVLRGRCLVILRRPARIQRFDVSRLNDHTNQANSHPPRGSATMSRPSTLSGLVPSTPVSEGWTRSVHRHTTFQDPGRGSLKLFTVILTSATLLAILSKCSRSTWTHSNGALFWEPARKMSTSSRSPVRLSSHGPHQERCSLPCLAC